MTIPDVPSVASAKFSVLPVTILIVLYSTALTTFTLRELNDDVCNMSLGQRQPDVLRSPCTAARDDAA